MKQMCTRPVVNEAMVERLLEIWGGVTALPSACRENETVVPKKGEAAGLVSAAIQSAFLKPCRARYSSDLLKCLVLGGVLWACTHLLVVKETSDIYLHQFRIIDTEDKFDMAIQRGDAKYKLRPMARIKRGDIIGLFYSATKTGYIAVFSHDQARRTTLLYPSRRTESASIAAKHQAPLPDGAVVEQGTGCEWFVAVFSDKPLSLKTLSAQIAESHHVNNSCNLILDIKDARTVRVLPLRYYDKP